MPTISITLTCEACGAKTQVFPELSSENLNWYAIAASVDWSFFSYVNEHAGFLCSHCRTYPDVPNTEINSIPLRSQRIKSQIYNHQKRLLTEQNLGDYISLDEIYKRADIDMSDSIPSLFMRDVIASFCEACPEIKNIYLDGVKLYRWEDVLASGIFDKKLNHEKSHSGHAH